MFRAFTRNVRLVWAAVLFFFVANWVNQDYLAPQSFTYVLYLAIVALVVPLQQDVQRNHDAAGLVEHHTGHEAPSEEPGGHDAGFDQRQPDADGDDPARVRDRAADLGHREEYVERGLPLRDRLLDQRKDQPLDDLLDRLAGRQRLT